MIMRKLYICTLLFCFLSSSLMAKTLSPLDFDLEKAKTGLEKYEILLKCHQYAVELKCGVSYKGIDSLFLEIPQGATGIPLTDNTDFSNAVITVKNNTKDIYLFTMIHPVDSIQFEALQVDKGDFSRVDKLKRGDYIVVLKDLNPWVEERIGYGYPHYRRDVLFVHNGRSVNSVIMPYNNNWSRVECSYRPVSCRKKLFQNLVFVRDGRSTYKTCLLRVLAEHNLVVKNVKVTTPSNDVLYGDHVFMVEDCTNFTLEDVVVDGTYSQLKKYGYAFGLNNVWGHKALRVTADGKWGVYGNNNINEAELTDCNINRFDIHSYGYKVKFEKCHFFRLYNAFGGTYGIVEYDRCIFNDFRPYLDGGSYNSYVPLDIIFNRCTITLKKNAPWLIEYLEIPKGPNQRAELQERFLPNVTIRNCTIRLSEGEKKWYIYKSQDASAITQFKGGEVFLKRIEVKDGSPEMEKIFKK